MIATLDELRDQLSLTADVAATDDAMLGRMLAAAQSHVEHQLGFSFEAAEADPPRQGFEDGTPADLVQAVLMLAAHWYETREAASDASMREVPFGVAEIVASHRDWTF